MGLNEIEQYLQYMNEIKWEWTIFTIHERERMIFTVCEPEQMIMQYALFKDLMRNDWKMTENEEGKYLSWL